MSEKRQRVKIISWKPTAEWTWNVQNEEYCGICQNKFEVAAPGVRWPGDNSTLLFGQCGHVFHLQCIMKWLNQPDSKNTCPVCRQYFDFQLGDH